MSRVCRVCVGIVTYNSLADLPACFAGLAAQTYRDLEIVVVDNASQDAGVVWLQRAKPDIRLILNDRNLGFAQAHNQAMRAHDLQPGDYYMPLNPDVVLDPDYVTRVVQVLQDKQDEQGGWATGKLLLRAGSGQGAGLLYSVGHGLRRDGYALNIGYHLPDAGQFDSVREIFGCPGAAPIISQALIASIAENGDLFDRDMFLYGEDTDLDWRARRLGWRCWYVPDAIAYHRGSQASRAMQVQALGNRYLSVIKNAYLVDLFFYNLPMMGVHCLIRLTLTPRDGWTLLRQVVRLSFVMWHKRRPPCLERSAMLAWFQWSSLQPTGQPIGVTARFRRFRRR